MAYYYKVPFSEIKNLSDDEWAAAWDMLQYIRTKEKESGNKARNFNQNR